MAPDWIEVLTDPAGVRTGASPAQADYRGAAALILQGRLLDYSMQRERDNSLPPLDAAEWPVDQDRALLLAILHHVQGGYAAAIERFRQLLAGPLPPDAVVVSGVLGSMALAETDQHSECVDLLETIWARLGDPDQEAGSDLAPEPVRLTGRLLTRLHIGRRGAERGDRTTAIEATQAVAAVQPFTSKTVRLLQHVARSNLDNYRVRAPDRDAPSRGRRLSTVPGAMQRRLRDSRAALAQLLEDDARIAFADPLRPRSYYASEDRTDRHLWAATHHGEVLADFAGTRNGRRDLGRYRLLAAVHSEPIRADGQPDSDDFNVLLQADDREGLQRAAHWFLRRGPLEGLAEFVNRVARRAWLAEYELATLGLLRAAGDLLSRDAAARVVQETLALAHTEPPDMERSFWAAYEALRTLAAVLPAAEDVSHERAAASLLALEQRGREATLTSAVRAALSTIRWADVSHPTRAAWEGRALEGADSGVSETVILALRHSEPEWTQLSSLRMYREDRTLRSAAVAVDAGASLTAEEVAQAVDDARASLRAERDDAHAGRYLKKGLNTALLLAVLLIRQERPRAWSTVLDYLADPEVLAASKRGVLEFLASRTAHLPPAAADQLGTILRSGLASKLMSFDTGSAYALEPQVLGLRLALEDVSRPEARDRLLRLASDHAPLSRIQAARVAPLAVNAIGSEAVLVTVLLSRDLHHEVRAAAGAALMSIATSSPEQVDVGTMAANELPRLADEPGVAVPLALLHAVRAGDASQPVELLRRQIHALRGSRSAAVRAAALAARDGLE